ncbi:MAG: hypothetical protein ACOVT5_09840 [Armatimonadaceae bacterium]|jgi:hypothetical protein
MKESSSGNAGKYSIIAALVGYALGFAFSSLTGIGFAMGPFTNAVPPLFAAIATGIGAFIAIRETQPKS